MMSTRIFFDHQVFSQQEYGGISRYFCELITGINQTHEHKAHLSLLFSNNAHLREVNLKAYPFLPNFSFPKKLEILYRINQLHTAMELKRSNYDLFHATSYDPSFIPHLRGKPFVVTFYDAIHERFGGQYKELSDVSQIIEHKKLLAKQATGIIAISASTKNDLVELHGVDPDKVHVVHLGSSFGAAVQNESPAASFPYILYVGKRDAYKNFPKFLTAVSPLLNRDKLTLICAGGGVFTDEEQALIRQLNLESLVTYRPINDKTLQGLYGSARVFVFPSLYEGFGIPVLEAFACGCPCVLSNTSSLPEVADDAALYVDPTNEISITQAVEQVITDDALRNSLIAKGYQRLNQFSWERTVAQTLAVYEKCL